MALRIYGFSFDGEWLSAWDFSVNEVTRDKSYRFDNTWKYRLMKNSFFLTFFFLFSRPHTLRGVRNWARLEALLELFFLISQQRFMFPKSQSSVYLRFFLRFQPKIKYSGPETELPRCCCRCLGLFFLSVFCWFFQQHDLCLLINIILDSRHCLWC